MQALVKGVATDPEQQWLCPPWQSGWSRVWWSRYCRWCHRGEWTCHRGESGSFWTSWTAHASNLHVTWVATDNNSWGDSCDQAWWQSATSSTAKEVLYCLLAAYRYLPGLAALKASQPFSKLRLIWRQMSAWITSGKVLNTYYVTRIVITPLWLDTAQCNYTYTSLSVVVLLYCYQRHTYNAYTKTHNSDAGVIVMVYWYHYSCYSYHIYTCTGYLIDISVFVMMVCVCPTSKTISTIVITDTRTLVMSMPLVSA